jgi:hypothetical protein
MTRSLSSISGAIAALIVLALALALAPSLAGAQMPVPPLGIGPFAVACNNVAQDFTRMKPGENPESYWEGIPAADGRPRYVTDLVTDPVSTPTLAIAVPNDTELYGNFANRTYTATLLICYPTSVDNARPAYALPNGQTVPRMQRGAEAPIFPDATRWPILVFSHGLGGSPLSEDYIKVATLFASYGYVIVEPFHGDARVTDIKLEDFNDAVYAALHFSDYIALQTLRPLALKLALDHVLTHPFWRDHVDSERIAGFGASLGGESLLLQAGAKVTTTVGQASKQVLVDQRLKAVVTYVPYFGQPFIPAFGRDQKGLDFIEPIPVLAISGTADTTAPLGPTKEGMQRLVGTRILVTLEGVEHGFDVPSTGDIFTWSLIFLYANLSHDPTSRASLQRMTGVTGGGDDRIVLDYVQPAPPQGAEANVIEYYNASLDHYFITAEAAEAAMLDAGVIVPGWTRTGYDFKAWQAGTALGAATCRFFGTPGIGPNSHFYTIDADECAKVRVNPNWMFESFAFQALAPASATCPADRMLVTRLYNNGMGGQASHRYTTSPSVKADMLANGWIEEGPVFCTPS